MADQDPVDKNKKDTILQLYTEIGKLGRHRVKIFKNTIALDRGPFRVLYPDTIYGIEFEVENIQELQPAETWQHIFAIDKDGSLRNHGLEIKLCSRGEHLESALNFYDKKLPKQTDFSFRTSIHVHVDVRDLTPEQSWCMIALSMLYERAFYRLAGMERRATAFCVPAAGTALPAVIRTTAAAALEKGDFRSQLEVCRRNWSKYLGTNILTMAEFGTIEYRQMRGHRDMGLLVNWLNLLGGLKQRAKQSSFKKLIEEIRELNTNSHYLEFTRETFPGHANILTRDEHFIMDLEAGVIFCKHAFSPVTKVLEFLRSVKEDSSYYCTFPSDVIRDDLFERAPGKEGDEGGGPAERVKKAVRFRPEVNPIFFNAPLNGPADGVEIRGARLGREKLTEAFYRQQMSNSQAFTGNVIDMAPVNLLNGLENGITRQLDILSDMYEDFDTGNVDQNWNILWKDGRNKVDAEYQRLLTVRNFCRQRIDNLQPQEQQGPQ